MLMIKGGEREKFEHCSSGVLEPKLEKSVVGVTNTLIGERKKKGVKKLSAKESQKSFLLAKALFFVFPFKERQESPNYATMMKSILLQ